MFPKTHHLCSDPTLPLRAGAGAPPERAPEVVRGSCPDRSGSTTSGSNFVAAWPAVNRRARGPAPVDNPDAAHRSWSGTVQRHASLQDDELPRRGGRGAAAAGGASRVHAAKRWDCCFSCILPHE